MNAFFLKNLIVLPILCSGLIGQAQDLHAPVQLKCEYTENPMNIDTRHPRFFWEYPLHDDFRQTAFEIIVGDDRKAVQSGLGNMWSAKVNSTETIQIAYEGKELQSFHRYYYKVKGYTGETSTDWSQVSWFETAMLDSTDWSAEWISDGSANPATDEDYYKPDQMPIFRKSFLTKKKIASAKLYISGLGYYEAYLNGKRVGNNVLDPGFTTPAKTVLYSVYDVTELCRKQNTIGVMLGNGWWNPLPFKLFGRWDLRDYQQTGRPCFIAELHLKYADGSIEKAVTDSSWLCTPGPVIRNNVYLGETYDARLEKDNWNVYTKNLDGWKPCEEVDGPDGELTSQMQPPIEVTQTIIPKSVFKLRGDTFIVDMGQNFAGVAQIKVRGNNGTRIGIRYGEDLFADSSLNYMTTVATQIKEGGISGGPGAPATAWQEDEYICKGGAVETWHPRFTFHGFRYLEITGWPGQPTIDDIRGLRMNSELKTTGSFSCSNQALNKLNEIIQWTFLSNVFSVQSDCPAREKMGYGGDMVATAQSFIYNYNMAQFYSKTVSDFANEQRPEGGITEIAPFTGIADRGYGDLSGPLGWQLAFPYLQKQLYEYYGDKRIIEEYYPAFKRQMGFLQSEAVGNLFYWDISDHEALDAKPEALSASAFYYHHAQLGESFAGVLDKKEDAAEFHKLSENIKRAIIQKFLVKNTGRFDNATQSAQLFALNYGLTPEDSLSFAWLKEEFERHDWHISTGIFTTEMLFNVLRKRNENELLYKLATQPDFPGWLNMINNGATTLWETWDYPHTGPSQNHPMFGSIEEWFYESLLGINNGGNAFQKIIIKPQPAGDLTWAKGSYKSIRGEIVSEWKLEGGKYVATVVVPSNCSATVFVPTSDANILVNGKKMSITLVQGYAKFECGSGTYLIESAYHVNR